ncbi:BTB/POZ domain-containing protein KCTD9a [Garra rufa]|uniref:BTB/POZ domain-containing protein KCTD9a n=1 Tax=Garra rufa TaxID=137080 RepID=UPI003CCEF249
MRRVTLFVNGTSKNGKVVAVYGTLSDLLTVASNKLGIRACNLYNGKGGLIDDIALIRDDDVLYVSEGDAFIDPQSDGKTSDDISGSHTDWLTLNIGGRLFTTTSRAAILYMHIFIFYILFFMQNSHPPEDHSPLSRKEFVRFLLATPTKSELRCQGLNFSGADLSRLDLRYINFKMANLSRCNLTYANLCCSNLERADLSGANLDGANLQGVKMLCSNAEGASLKGCNFEDPSGLKANLEGANLKGVDMEGSQMTGINLRVATLKNAKLKNCNLRGATLAGTDLENCDLSGCDLQEANLRGSNVKGAIFEEMLTPLHMSQSVR